MITVIAEAVPSGIVQALRSLLEFQYLSQSPVINDDECCKISAALQEFHDYKQNITDASTCQGEKGNVIEHWNIPKLEVMQNVAPSIPLIGLPFTGLRIQQSTLTSMFFKIPAINTNNIDIESQICRYLDRQEKCHAFSLALHIREKEDKSNWLRSAGMDLDLDDDDSHQSDSDLT